MDSIKYKNSSTGRGIKISSENFNNVMFWSPSSDADMLSIEFTSQLPIAGGEKHFEDLDRFELLAPGESKSYSIKVQLFK